MKNILILFVLFPFICNAQSYHYPFGYNHSGLNRIDDAFFDELGKDLGRTIIEGESYHSLPLLYIDPANGIIDLEQSMLAIRSAVLAMYGCGGNRSDIWLIATSDLSDVNHTESLKAIKKYFVLLGLDQDKIHIQESLLERDIEDQLKLKTPVVLKRKP